MTICMLLDVQEISCRVLSCITVIHWVLLYDGYSFKSFARRIFQQIRDDNYLVGRKLQNRTEATVSSFSNHFQLLVICIHRFRSKPCVCVVTNLQCVRVSTGTCSPSRPRAWNRVGLSKRQMTRTLSTVVYCTVWEVVHGGTSLLLLIISLWRMAALYISFYISFSFYSQIPPGRYFQKCLSNFEL